MSWELVLETRPQSLARKDEPMQRVFGSHARVFLPTRVQKSCFLLYEIPHIPSCHRMLSVAILLCLNNGLDPNSESILLTVYPVQM